jgi:two-component system CheB/CheR fusion protein
VGLRVLVVEDDRATVETLRELLTMEGASVVLAHHGREALAALDRQAIDVVVSDISMPEMDGYELLAAIRARPGGGDLPVVALTGLARPADARRLRSAGFTASLGKPFTLDGLTRVLQQVLATSETRRQRQNGE